MKWWPRRKSSLEDLLVSLHVKVDQVLANQAAASRLEQQKLDNLAKRLGIAKDKLREAMDDLPQ